jgi:DNA-binding MarR family transcriptional regulator
VTGKLQSELKQKKPFSSREEEAFISILLTSDVLFGKLTGVLKESGLSPTQYNVLRILRGAGVDGLACGEISNRMITRDPDVTRLLDRLEKRGLASRAREQKDRRVITARITEEGLDLLKCLDRPVDRFNKQVLGHVTEKDLTKLINILEAAREQIR